MRLSDLVYAKDHLLPSPTILHRLQRRRARPGSVAIGPLRLPPAALAKGRFDLRAAPVGYFAESAETALFETLGRREAISLPLATLRDRMLLTVRTAAALPLIDLRHHAQTFPVLQSLRYSETQELAEDVLAAGYQGIVYRSAQQHGADCYAIFGPALTHVRLESKADLVHAGVDADRKLTIKAA